MILPPCAWAALNSSPWPATISPCPPARSVGLEGATLPGPAGITLDVPAGATVKPIPVRLATLTDEPFDPLLTCGV